MRSTTRGSLSFCAWRRTSSSLEMVALFPFANVGRILPIIAHFSEYVELFMRTYIGVPMGRPLDKKEAVLYGQFVHAARSEEHTSELQSLTNLVCRLLLEKKNTKIKQ